MNTIENVKTSNNTTTFTITSGFEPRTYTMPTKHFNKIKHKFVVKTSKPVSKGTMSLTVLEQDIEYGYINLMITHKHKDTSNDISERLLSVVEALSDFIIEDVFYTGDQGIDDACIKIDYDSLKDFREAFKLTKKGV